MFVHHIRYAALSLALAAMAAAVTLSTAAAAPIPAAGASAADAVAGTVIKLPMANVVVTKRSKEGDPSQSQKYFFDVKNFGPDAANVKIKKEAIWFDSTGTAQQTLLEFTTAFDVGELQTVEVDCDPGSGGYCYGGTLIATVIGLDPNTSNNSDYYRNPLP